MGNEGAMLRGNGIDVTVVENSPNFVALLAYHPARGDSENSPDGR